MSSLSTPAPPLDALGARHQQFLKAARVPLLDAEAAIGRRLSVEQIEDLARKKRRVQTLTVLLSLFLLMLTVLFTLIFLPQRLGLLSKHDEAHENLLGQGQLFFLLLGGYCYYDDARRLIQTNAFVAYQTERKLTLAGPFQPSQEAVAALSAAGRLRELQEELGASTGGRRDRALDSRGLLVEDSKGFKGASSVCSGCIHHFSGLTSLFLT